MTIDNGDSPDEARLDAADAPNLDKLEAADQADTPNLDTIPDEKLRRVLELNGFNAVRTEILAACRAIGGLPLDAIDAALIYNDEARARLKLHPNPAAHQALALAKVEARYLALARRWRRELGELEEILAASARIVAP